MRVWLGMVWDADNTGTPTVRLGRATRGHGYDPTWNKCCTKASAWVIRTLATSSPSGSVKATGRGDRRRCTCWLVAPPKTRGTPADTRVRTVAETIARAVVRAVVRAIAVGAPGMGCRWHGGGTVVVEWWYAGYGRVGWWWSGSMVWQGGCRVVVGRWYGGGEGGGSAIDGRRSNAPGPRTMLPKRDPPPTRVQAHHQSTS